MGETSTRMSDGLTKVYSSPRPFGTTTYFSGAGDDVINSIVGGGDRLLYNLTSTDISKSIEIEFLETIYIKDGYMITENAPFGSYLDIEIIHPVSGVVGCFGKKIPILGNSFIPMDSEDRGEIAQGLKIRITVFNSDGLNGQDPATAFKLVGRLEMYRSNTL